MSKNLDQLITEQVRTWSLSQSTPQKGGRAPGAWPIITISREFGAQGAALATVLGRRTGFEVWDRDLLQAIAKETGGDAAILSSLDEHRRKTVEDAVHGFLQGSKHTNIQYFRALLRVIHTIALHGKSIIVGRGANYVGRAEKMLRVRIVCPLEVRIRRYAQRQEISEEAARRKIEAMDADRADFIRFQFKRDVSDAADYDIVLNAGVYTLDQMAGLVLDAYAAKMGKRPAEVE